jgi:hypothetical protein
MIFPSLVYRCPGPHQRAGGTYEHRQVSDEYELAAAIEVGWFATLPEAIAGKSAEPLEPIEPTAQDDAPPTRVELKRKAAELGLVHAPNVTDAKLAAMIDAALTPKG